jgi:DNA replication protein DnaC
MSMNRRTLIPPPDDRLRQRARALGLMGLLAHWEELGHEPTIGRLVTVEEEERQRRSLERRLKNARIGRFKPIADFDWSWPRRIEREAIEELFTFAFLEEGAHVVFVGPNGVGKSTIAQNLAHQALLKGHTVCFTTASQMLNELVAQDGPAALERRLRRYSHPQLLCVDEVGYLSYDSRHADLLFEVVSRRQEGKSIVVTTNRPFAEWKEVFPNATCVVALVDRLVHRAQILPIEGESYRLKEAKEREALRAKQRAERKQRRR